MPKILVVDDEPDAIELIKFNLKSAGYDVATAADGDEALKKARALLPDLIILDVMLPEVDGLEVCKILRRDARVSAIPIIMLTAKAEEVDKIVGLELGADDYVTKPFSPREVVARVRAVLRRSQTELALGAVPGPLSVDAATRRARANGSNLELTRVEFDVLACLLEQPGRVYSRGELITRVWGDGFAITDRTIDSHVKALRKKVAEAGAEPGLIETVRGVGYRVTDTPSASKEP